MLPSAWYVPFASPTFLAGVAMTTLLGLGLESLSSLAICNKHTFPPRPSEAEAMILPRTPDESLVVDVARGLDSGSMIEQAHRMVVLTFCITLYMVLKCPEIICAKAIFLSSQLLYQSSS